jgi:hypothetical protein
MNTWGHVATWAQRTLASPLRTVDVVHVGLYFAGWVTWAHLGNQGFTQIHQAAYHYV